MNIISIQNRPILKKSFRKKMFFLPCGQKIIFSSEVDQLQLFFEKMIIQDQKCFLIARISFFAHFRKNGMILLFLSTKFDQFLLKRCLFKRLQALVKVLKLVQLHFFGRSYICFLSTINIIEIHPIVMAVQNGVGICPN